MVAIIDATGYHPEMTPLLYYRPSPLLCVGGKPIIFHVIEFLIQHGMKEFELVLNHLPEKIEGIVGDGKRWGIKTTYHLARDPECVFQAAKLIALRLGRGSVIFAQGDELPKFDPAALMAFPSREPLLFMYPEKVWSGWGILPVGTLANAPRTTSNVGFASSLSNYATAGVQPFISAKTPGALLKANTLFLNREHALSVFPTTARRVEPMVWISRGVMLHPTATIVPPVFIGEFCQVNKDVCIGPNATIEDYCIVGEGSEIVDSLVCKHSYVGEDLDIHDSIVDRNLLLSLSVGSHITVTDSFILGESHPRHILSKLFHLFERVVAAIFLTLLSPLYLYMRLTHPLNDEKILKLTAPHDPLIWNTADYETFGLTSGQKSSAFYRFSSKLPLLKGVVRGEIHFVGVRPRSRTEVEKLPPDWKKLYISSKVGILTVSTLEGEDEENLDKAYASECLYAIKKNLCYDFRIILKWIAKKYKPSTNT